MGSGTGNANFFYASTLVFGLANGAVITDALGAGLKIGFGWNGKERKMEGSSEKEAGDGEGTWKLVQA